MLVMVREMVEEDSHLRLDNLENIGMNQLKIIRKILEKNNIPMGKLFKINKMEMKKIKRENSNQINHRLKNQEDNLKIEMISLKEWDITSELLFPKKLLLQQHNKVSNQDKPARNSTTALPNLLLLQRQDILQRTQTRPIKTLS
jgi:hypothetical protein